MSRVTFEAIVDGKFKFFWKEFCKEHRIASLLVPRSMALEIYREGWFRGVVVRKMIRDGD